MHKIHAHYVHHLPRPEEPPKPKALHPITDQSKWWFSQSWVVGARTQNYRFEWWFGCLRN